MNFGTSSFPMKISCYSSKVYGSRLLYDFKHFVLFQVYRELSHKNNLYEVTREMARYYTTCTSKDAAELMASPYPKSIPRHFHT